jgi:hypothetical protein
LKRCKRRSTNRRFSGDTGISQRLPRNTTLIRKSADHGAPAEAHMGAMNNSLFIFQMNSRVRDSHCSFPSFSGVSFGAPHRPSIGKTNVLILLIRKVLLGE